MVTRWHTTACPVASVSLPTPQACRRYGCTTCGTELPRWPVRPAADMKAVQTLLRHSSLAITADTYTSVFDEETGDVAERMSQIVPRKAAAVGASGTARLPSGSRGRTNAHGLAAESKSSHVKTSGASGARTRNPRIKRRPLHRSERTACTDVPRICPESTHCTPSSLALVPRNVPRHRRYAGEDPSPSVA